ncbi:MAG: LURP-one-related family protein [Candidatus Aminicenantes bacterium]|nr:LURP-one-related family protein [Candidatus Aminicenantes bacterium]
MKQKIWTIADRFVIRDEYKNPMFYVKEKVFSFGDKLKFFDMDGNELAYIKQKVFSFKKQYKIYRNKELLARVVKKITLFKDKFIIDIPGPNDYIVKGNFTDHRYTFIRNGRGVAFISKKWLSWGDTYRIEIVPGEDDVVILAAAVIIDMISHGNEEHYYHHSHF